MKNCVSVSFQNSTLVAEGMFDNTLSIPSQLITLRRFTPGDGFLEALVADNTTVVTEDIECVIPKGIKTIDGTEYEVDAIICATGFDVSQR